MWIVIGSKTTYVENPKGLRVPRHCTTCRKDLPFVEVIPEKYFTLFWVPVFRTERDSPLLRCTQCETLYRITADQYREAEKEMLAEERAGTGWRRGAVEERGGGTSRDERVVVHCPSCRTGARVPRTADKLRVKCPKCESRYEVVNGVVT